MKDGTTRMGSQAEHAVDLETDIVVAVNVQPGNAPDTATIIDTVIDAAVNAEQAGVETNVAARSGERREAAPDDGRGAEPLDDHAGDHRNRWSEEPSGPPRASAHCLDSLRSPHIGAGSPGGGAGLVGDASHACPPHLTVIWSVTKKTTWATAC
jgi:hypothetical protein